MREGHWVKLDYTKPYPNYGRWFWQWWKPKTVNLPVYQSVWDESIVVVYGQIGNLIIEESLDNV